MVRDTKIDYIEFNASDIPATQKFYTDLFEWKLTDYGPEYTSFEDGRIAGGFRKGLVSPAGRLIVIFVNDLSKAEDRVKDAGGKITKDFFVPGRIAIHFSDPDGNVLAAWHED
jgi:predicted enzyme related to lactoylglutathione lyase